MFIIWGWGFKTTKVFGARNERCFICTGTSFSYVRVITWFTLFFIPLIPYSFKYIKVCNQCGNGSPLKKEQFFQELEAPETEPLPSPFETETEDMQELCERTITLIREKKKLFGALMKIFVYIDGQNVSTLKNGETAAFITDNRRHNMYASTATADGEIRSNIITLENSDENMTFDVKFTSGGIILSPAEQNHNFAEQESED